MKISMIILILLFLTFLSGCDRESNKRIGLKELGIDKTKGQLVEYLDTHGALGEGCTYIRMEFNGINAKETDSGVRRNGKWLSLPLTDNLKKAIYRTKTRASLLQMLDRDIPPVPNISNGYYYFYDRNEESTDRKDDFGLLSRSSVHFDFLLYDMDQHTLYLIQLDT